MTTQHLFYASPHDPIKTGFYFSDLETYRVEYDHWNALFGAQEIELQAIDGEPIDLELFIGLKINQGTLAEWFEEIQPLTNEEKVGLWFLVCWCGHRLTPAQEIVQDGMTIYHGTKLAWAKEWLECSGGNFVGERDGAVQEFRLGGETWCVGSVGS